jgi:RNA polymerase sigma-70 factor (ECF subfamily)
VTVGGSEPVATIDDGEVMRMVRDGDVGQLGILFERHHGRLYNYCLRLTGNAETSRDLVQEVFFRILKYRETYRDDGSFLPWFYRLARNACYDHLRGSGREVPADVEAMEEVDPGPAPSEEAERRQEVRLLSRALHRLPVDKRELLVMARFGALGYREIAETLGTSVGAVRVRVHRALKELRQVYLRMEREATS